jgi:hypothetical protein
LDGVFGTHTVNSSCSPTSAEQAWTPVRYPGAVWDEETGQWISQAEVAETIYTPFATSRHPITARLVVRRIRERNPAPEGQEELFPMWRYTAPPRTSFGTVGQRRARRRSPAAPWV